MSANPKLANRGLGQLRACRLWRVRILRVGLKPILRTLDTNSSTWTVRKKPFRNVIYESFQESSINDVTQFDFSNSLLSLHYFLVLGRHKIIDPLSILVSFMVISYFLSIIKEKFLIFFPFNNKNYV